MAAAAIGPLIGAGASLGSGLLNFFGAKKASTPTPQESAATQGELNASNALAASGTALTNFGMPKLQQAGNYFSTLASGNRSATGQLLAPEVANINDTYAGANSTLSRYMYGPQRAYYLAQSGLQRSGQIGSLFSGARQVGLSGLTSLGEYGTSAGNAATSGAAGIAGNVVGQQQTNRGLGAGFSSQAGASTAALIFQLLKSGLFQFGGKGGGGGGSIPNLPGVSGWGGGLPGVSLPGLSLPNTGGG